MVHLSKHSSPWCIRMDPSHSSIVLLEEPDPETYFTRSHSAPVPSGSPASKEHKHEGNKSDEGPRYDLSVVRALHCMAELRQWPPPVSPYSRFTGRKTGRSTYRRSSSCDVCLLRGKRVISIPSAGDTVSSVSSFHPLPGTPSSPSCSSRPGPDSSSHGSSGSPSAARPCLNTLGNPCPSSTSSSTSHHLPTTLASFSDVGRLAVSAPTLVQASRQVRFLFLQHIWSLTAWLWSVLSPVLLHMGSFFANALPSYSFPLRSAFQSPLFYKLPPVNLRPSALFGVFHFSPGERRERTRKEFLLSQGMKPNMSGVLSLRWLSVQALFLFVSTFLCGWDKGTFSSERASSAFFVYATSSQVSSSSSSSSPPDFATAFTSTVPPSFSSSSSSSVSIPSVSLLNEEPVLAFRDLKGQAFAGVIPFTSQVEQLRSKEESVLSSSVSPHIISKLSLPSSSSSSSSAISLEKNDEGVQTASNKETVANNHRVGNWQAEPRKDSSPPPSDTEAGERGGKDFEETEASLQKEQKDDAHDLSSSSSFSSAELSPKNQHVSVSAEKVQARFSQEGTRQPSRTTAEAERSRDAAASAGERSREKGIGVQETPSAPESFRTWWARIWNRPLVRSTALASQVNEKEQDEERSVPTKGTVGRKEHEKFAAAEPSTRGDDEDVKAGGEGLMTSQGEQGTKQVKDSLVTPSSRSADEETSDAPSQVHHYHQHDPSRTSLLIDNGARVLAGDLSLSSPPSML